MSQIVWMLKAEILFRNGGRGAPSELGIFTAPEKAFEVVRSHPDYPGAAEITWRSREWGERTAYFAQTSILIGRNTVQWEISVIPLVLNEPIFDYVEDREEYDRIRASRE